MPAAIVAVSSILVFTFIICKFGWWCYLFWQGQDRKFIAKAKDIFQKLNFVHELDNSLIKVLCPCEKASFVFSGYPENNIELIYKRV